MIDLTFDDEASGFAPTVGIEPDGHYTYKPSGFYGDSFSVPKGWPYPATNPPPGPLHLTLSAMDGTAANGQWELYAFDLLDDDGGILQDGWSIDLVSENVPEPTMLCAGVALVLMLRRR